MDERGAGCSITVAHRLTTIRHSDLIIVMDKGRCVEQGSHDELMSVDTVKTKGGKVKQGYYHNLWDVQQGGGGLDSLAAKGSSEAAMKGKRGSASWRSHE